MTSETENTDLILARRVASGEALAQEELFNNFKGFVYSGCLKIVRHHETAEDLSQIVFTQIYRKIDTFAGDSKLKTWIYAIVLNHCRMYLRNQKKHQHVVSLTDLEDFRAPALSVNPDEQILLESCIAQLPPSYRSFFVLHDVMGLEHHECAAMLGKSEGTSKSQLFKARQKMRKLIARRANPKASSVI